MKEPRVKDNDPNNTLYAGSDLYDYAFDLHYAPSFQCPDITECIPPTLRAMLRAIPRVANLEGYATGCKNALKETMYLSNWYDGGAVWNEFLMQRSFVSRYPVVKFQGCLGGYLGDAPGSMYFIEVKLNEFGEFFLFKHPAAFITIPYSLINGHYSHYTNILPHNLNKIIDALILLMNKPNASLDEILGIIKGPDFPFGCEIRINKEELYQIYMSGQGDIEILSHVLTNGSSVSISHYPPFIEEFGIDDYFDLKGFEQEFNGKFEKGDTVFHLQTNEPEALMKKIADSPILKRKVPIDFNFIVKREVKCVGIKRILSCFISNLQQQYAKRYEGCSPSEVNDMIIKEWEKIKSTFGDERRTTITIVK